MFQLKYGFIKSMLKLGRMYTNIRHIVVEVNIYLWFFLFILGLYTFYKRSSCCLFHILAGAIVPSQIFHLKTHSTLYRPMLHLAPVPLSIFRSNSKFDENSKHSSVKYTRPITTIFCTRHDSVTVVTCAKYRCDRSSIFETRAFWIFIEFRIRSKYA